MQGRKLKSRGKLGSCDSDKQILSDCMSGVGLPGKIAACRIGEEGLSIYSSSWSYAIALLFLRMCET